MSDGPLRRLPRAALTYGLGDAIPKAASLLLLPLVTRLLEPREYGLVAAVAVLAGFLALLSHASLTGAFFRFSALDDGEAGDHRRRLLGTLLTFTLVWTATVVGAAALCALLFPGAEPGGLPRVLLLLAAALAAANALSSLPLAALQAQERPGAYRAVTFLTFSASTLGMMAGLLLWRRDALGAVFGQVAGTWLGCAAAWAAVRGQWRLSVDRPLLRRCLVYSAPLAAYTLGGWVIDGASRLLLEQALGLRELGFYQAGVQVALAMSFLLNAVGLAYTPLFYKMIDAPGGTLAIARFGGVYWAFTVAAALGFALLAHSIAEILVAPAFRSAGDVIPLLVGGHALTCLWHLYANPLFARERTGLLAGTMALAALTGLALNAALIPRLGSIGAALSTFVSLLGLTAVVALRSRRILPIPYPVGRMSAVAAVAAVIFAMSCLLPPLPLVKDVVARAALWCLYPLVLVVTGLLEARVVVTVWRNLTRATPVSAS